MVYYGLYYILQDCIFYIKLLEFYHQLDISLGLEITFDEFPLSKDLPLSAMSAGFLESNRIICIGITIKNGTFTEVLLKIIDTFRKLDMVE